MSFRANAQNHGLRAFWGPLGWREWPIPCVVQHYGMAPITPPGQGSPVLALSSYLFGAVPTLYYLWHTPKVGLLCVEKPMETCKVGLCGKPLSNPTSHTVCIGSGLRFLCGTTFFLNADQGDQPDKGCPGESHRPFFSFQRPPPPGFSQIFIFLNPKTSHL